jgi:branched-subunit amino acid aminotransferase/4-amino-4-deoxychorismate lyase
MEEFAYWYDGNLVQGSTLELAIDDPALLYGATLFTTLRVYQLQLEHPLTNWQAHCNRLQTSLETFQWQPPNWQRLRQGAELLLQTFPVLRITLFPDGREWITGRFLPADLAERQHKGITAWVAESSSLCASLSPLQRSLPSHKTGNYLAPWLALQMAQRSHHAQEAILTTSTGNWLETSTGNLWGYRDNHWWTPPLQAGILPGLLRTQLITKIRCQNEEVAEAPWNPDLVETFEAIAYTNCVIEIIPIHTILRNASKKNYPSAHPGFAQLRRLFIDPNFRLSENF